MRSFTLYAGKNHYMTIASTNENDVSAIVKKIDPKNKNVVPSTKGSL